MIAISWCKKKTFLRLLGSFINRKVCFKILKADLNWNIRISNHYCTVVSYAWVGLGGAGGGGAVSRLVSCLTTFPNTKKRVVWKWGQTRSFVFDISSQSKLKPRRKRRDKIVKRSDIQTRSWSWFPVFKLDELLMSLRNCYTVPLLLDSNIPVSCFSSNISNFAGAFASMRAVRLFLRVQMASTEHFVKGTLIKGKRFVLSNLIETSKLQATC